VTTAYFVRHAHSPWVANREAERPLSARGREAAERVADLFDDRPLDAVVTSPYARARQTVEPIAERRDLDVVEVAGFRERRLADGPVETVGETFESAVRTVWDDWSVALPGGESNGAAQQRAVAALDGVVEEYADGSVAIGTHGQLLTLLLNHYDERFDEAYWREELTTPDVYEARFEDGELRGVERLYEPP